jgi:TLC domain
MRLWSVIRLAHNGILALLQRPTCLLTEQTCVHCSFLRVGSLIMVLHDPSDVLLEAAKMLNYTKQDLLSTAVFAAFMLSWVILRLVYFPFWIVQSTW